MFEFWVHAGLWAEHLDVMTQAWETVFICACVLIIANPTNLHYSFQLIFVIEMCLHTYTCSLSALTIQHSEVTIILSLTQLANIHATLLIGGHCVNICITEFSCGSTNVYILGIQWLQTPEYCPSISILYHGHRARTKVWRKRVHIHKYTISCTHACKHIYTHSESVYSNYESPCSQIKWDAKTCTLNSLLLMYHILSN